MVCQNHQKLDGKAQEQVTENYYRLVFSIFYGTMYSVYEYSQLVSWRSLVLEEVVVLEENSLEQNALGFRL